MIQVKFTTTKLKFLLSFMIFILFLNGCSFTFLPKDVQKSINKANSNYEKDRDQLLHSQNVINHNYVRHIDSVYFGSDLVTVKNANLPPVFNNPIEMDATFYSLSHLANAIDKISGVPVLLQADASTNMKPVKITQNFGTLADLLDHVTTDADISWKYENGKIFIQQTETRTWPIKNIPGTLQLQNQINNTAGSTSNTGGSSNSASSGGSGSSSGGSSSSSSNIQGNQQMTQNVQFSYSGDYWKALNNGIKTMLSKEGSYSINDQTSSITVTDRPSILERIGTYIDRQNVIMSRQVMIDVHVISVETDAVDNYGINWALALSGKDANFSMGTNPNNPAGKPLYTPSDSAQAFILSAPTSGNPVISGSSIIINALSTENKVSQVVATAAVTLSNQPVPINFTNQNSYVASIATTITGLSSSAQTSITPGQYSTGFAMNILPIIEDDGTVLLQTSISMSAEIALNAFTVGNPANGGGTIQLPELSNNSFMQKVAVKNGDTFVITGFDLGVNTLNKSGIGGSNNWLFGGGVNAQKTHTKLVILISPRIINS